MTDTLIERKDPPKWVQDRLTSKGGLNPYGEPNFRVIWGGNRTYLVGGMFNDVLYVKDAQGNDRAIVTKKADMRTLLKYHPFRWHMERWRGPEYYGDPDEWYSQSWDEECQMHVMGPYPDRGDYEHVFYLGMCPHMKPGDKDWCMPCKVGSGEYIPLEPNVAVLERQIWMLLESEKVSPPMEMAALFMRENIKRQVHNKIVGDRVRNAMRPVWATQPTSWQPGMGSKTSVPEAKMPQQIVMPRNKLGFSQSTRSMPNKKQKDMEEKKDDN